GGPHVLVPRRRVDGLGGADQPGPSAEGEVPLEGLLRAVAGAAGLEGGVRARRQGGGDGGQRQERHRRPRRRGGRGEGGRVLEVAEECSGSPARGDRRPSGQGPRRYAAGAAGAAAAGAAAASPFL